MGLGSCVQCPSSGVHCPASSVRSISPTVLKIISPYCIHIFVVCRLCAKIIVAPPIILNFLHGQK